MARPVILDCDGTELSAEEKVIFRDLDPFGFILFARNCQSPDQLKKLTDQMKEVVGREDVPILIDQEGGRVCRLSFDHWRKPPSAEQLANLYDKNPQEGLDVTKLNARLMAEELRHVGVTVDCYPCMDLRFLDVNKVIGDRSFGDDTDKVIKLSEAACEGLFAGGVIPIIKHIPGHGRALVDSHEELPIVETPSHILNETDFVPFKALSYMPLAMTAHIIYSDIDPELPTTLSEKVIRNVIREDIGFKGVLISDDITMKALSGDRGQLAKQALRAGCDLLLHCNASLDERRYVLEALYDFNMANENWVNSLFRRRKDIPDIDQAEVASYIENALKD